MFMVRVVIQVTGSHMNELYVRSFAGKNCSHINTCHVKAVAWVLQ